MNESEKYLLALAAMIAGICTAVAGFNAWIDPLWIFGHTHAMNQNQVLFSQRVQKTNYLYFGDRDFDSVMIGSSRCTALRESDFPSMRLFNYSMNNTYPAEFEGIIENFSAIQGPPKNILIGMDFYSTSHRNDVEPDPPYFYLRDARSPLYILRSLVSLDTLDYAIQSLQLSIDPSRDRFRYNRRNELSITPQRGIQREKSIRRQLVNFGRSYSDDDYEYQETGPQALIRIQRRYPEAEITVFIPPTTLMLYREMLESGRFGDYANWLGEIVASGVTVIDMLGINEFTKDSENFLDAHHFRVDRAEIIAEAIRGKRDGTFGRKVTPDNLSNHIENQRREAKARGYL